MEASSLSLRLLPSLAITQAALLSPALASSSHRSHFRCNWQISRRAAFPRLWKTKSWEFPGAIVSLVCVRATVATEHADSATTSSEADALASEFEGNAAAEAQIESGSMASKADALPSESEGNGAAETQTSSGSAVKISDGLPSETEENAAETQKLDLAHVGEADTSNSQEAVGSGKKPKALSPGKLARRAADWKRAAIAKENNEVVLGEPESLTGGGLVVRFYSILGYLPFSQLNHVKDERRNVGKELIGTIISLKVMEANEETKRLKFSEREAIRIQHFKQLRKGDLYEGRVNGVTDYGAFVDLRFPDGSYPLTGLVHMSELSWDAVRSPRDVLQVGQVVRVKIANVDLENTRLSLSIKQLEADPLLETLDSLMPINEQECFSKTAQSNHGELIGIYLFGIEQICNELSREEGITAATLGRRAIEKRVVSQDLELWLSNAVGDNGKFTLVARAGKQVEEIFVTATLDREGMKTAVQRVTSRVP